MMVLNDWFLALSVLMHRFLSESAVSARFITNQSYTNDTAIYPVSPKLNEVCPGVEYLINQNSTILQVNRSNCDNYLPQFSAHQGAVYAVCGDYHAFCVMHVTVLEGMYIRARLLRLAYWCVSHVWETQMLCLIGLVCNYHTIAEVFMQTPSTHVIISHKNYPLVKLDLKVVKHHNLIILFNMDFSGFVIVPNICYSQFFYKERLMVPSRHVIMVSVQQSFENNAQIEKRGMRLVYSKTNTTHQSVIRLCDPFLTSPKIIRTSHLDVLYTHKQPRNSLLKMYFSYIPFRNQPQMLSNSKFNCSVDHYSVFQEHLHCNLKPECEDGWDETEHCSFSSPECQGMVASRNKCFYLVMSEQRTTINMLQYNCLSIGGMQASVKTRKEWESCLLIFKKYHKLMLVFGNSISWKKMPFMYSKFRKWLDSSLIYNFRAAFLYHPSRKSKFVVLYSAGFDWSHYRPTETNAVLCENNQRPTIYASQIALALMNSYKSFFITTRQSLFRCLDNRVTHFHFSCDPISPYKITHLQFSEMLNDSDTNVTKVFPSRKGVSFTYELFGCDEETTSVHHTQLCDFRQDCPDNSDESFCQHPSCDGFLGTNGQCILQTQRCNEHSDCLDNSDEVKCNEISNYLQVLCEEDIKQRFYIDLDGTGYFTQNVMEDEESCPDSHYNCPSEWMYCLPLYTRCNGFSDCVYGEDEQNCERHCSGFYKCRGSHVCIHADHLCDGWGQCSQQDDELMCDRTCPEGCFCHGLSFVCHQSFSVNHFLHLRYLDATGSGMSLTAFDQNVYLVHLKLSHCSLTNISSLKLPNLQGIYLDNNQVRTLDMAIFLKLLNLRTLHLSNNPLLHYTNELRRHIHYTLLRLDISETCLRNIHHVESFYLPYLRYFNVSFSAIEVFGAIGLKTMPGITLLDVRGNPLQNFSRDLFSKSNYLQMLFSSNYRLCCENLFPKRLSEIKCVAPDAVLNSCSQLISNKFHLFFFWLECIFAVLGSSLCITISFAGEVFMNNFSVPINNLHFTDICMGVHVGIAVVANELFYWQYVQLEKTWTQSMTCKVNGFLFLLSTEVSVFIIGFITLDHILVLFFSKNSKRFHLFLTCVGCPVMWLVGTVLSLAPFLPGMSQWGLQDQSGLCRLTSFDHYYSKQEFRWFTVTVTINFVLSFMILSVQFFIHKRTPKFRIALNSFQRSVHSSVHVMEKVVSTHAMCWLSFGVIRMMSSHGLQFSHQIHDAMVVFVLPLSSALDPLLYIWAVSAQRRQQAQESRLLKMFRGKLSSSVSGTDNKQANRKKL